MHVAVVVRNAVSQMLGVRTEKPTVFVDPKGNIIEAVNVGGGARRLGSPGMDENVEIVQVNDIEEKAQRFTGGIKRSLARFGEVYHEQGSMFIIEAKDEEPSAISERIRNELGIECTVCISDSVRVLKAVCPFMDKDISFSEKDFREGKLDDLGLPDDVKEKIEFTLYDEDDLLDSLSGKVMDMDQKGRKESIGMMLDSLVKDEGMVYPVSGDIYVLAIREGIQLIKKITLKQDSRESIIERVEKAARFAEKIGIFIYSSKCGKEKRLTRFFGL
jgi:hypothetical protein